MFVLNVNTDTDTRLLIHSVIDLLKRGFNIANMCIHTECTENN